MAKLLQTRSLHRGLEILDELARGPASLQKLHEDTGLPKSTLRRLLATLVERRYIRRGISDGIYRTNVAIPNSTHGEATFRFGKLVEVARPHMMRLTEVVKWPSDLHVYHSGRMQILESTHGLSPFESAKGGHADSELNMFVAASGLAYLSTLEISEVAEIFDYAQRDYRWSPARFSMTMATLTQELAHVRERGFASRRLSQIKQDHRSAIAVPILQAHRPIGAITLIWRRDYMSVDEFGKTYAKNLIDTSFQIEIAL
jgi:IclR family mhp operon transcriptional activator